MYFLEIPDMRINSIFELIFSGKYQNSPYSKGTILWDCLPNNVIELPVLEA